MTKTKREIRLSILDKMVLTLAHNILYEIIEDLPKEDIIEISEDWYGVGLGVAEIQTHMEDLQTIISGKYIKRG